MKLSTTKCVILGHKNFSEKDKFIYIYTEEFGKIRLIAKDAKSLLSKFTGHLETLNFCTATIYFSKKNKILIEISTNKNFFKKTKNLSTLYTALKIAEITNKLLYEDQKLEGLYLLIKQTLKHLIKSRKKTLIFTAYVIKILDKSGLIPNFKETKNKLKKKYIKFFNFIKDKSFEEIEKIHLQKNEKEEIEKYSNHLIRELV